MQTINFTSGLANHLLIVTSTIHDNDAGCIANNLYLAPEFGGTPQPYLQFKTNATAICTDARTSTWAIDIDAEGLAGQPISICMEGSAYPTQAAYDVTTVAVQQAK